MYSRIKENGFLKCVNIFKKYLQPLHIFPILWSLAEKEIQKHYAQNLHMINYRAMILFIPNLMLFVKRYVPVT